MNKITINGKEFELKKITVGEWLEMAKIYDEIETTDSTNVGYIEKRCRVIELAFGLTQEEIKNLPAEEVIPLYLQSTKLIQESILSKLSEKKSEIENPVVDA